MAVRRPRLRALDKPGSFGTAQIGDYSVILVRDLKGTIRAFLTPAGIAAAGSRGREGRGRCNSAPITNGATILTGPIRAPGRRGFRKVGLWAENGRLRAWPGTCSSALPRRRPISPVPPDDQPYFAHRLAEAKVVHEHDCRARNWKLFGRTIASVTTARQPSRALQDFS